MGDADKLVMEAGGLPLLARSARAAVDSGLPVTVLLPKSSALHPARRAAVQGLPLQLVEARDAEDDMGASLAAGIASLPEGAEGVIVALADMPDITASDYRALARAHAETGGIIRAATEAGEPGNPVLFPAAHFPALARLKGDAGGRAVIGRHGARLCPLPGRRALTDLDTPEDWAAWRAGE